MPSMALYYPWMHFRNDNWLKLALLTWDSIVRVRPRDVPDRDDELVRQLRAESDLLTEIVPSESDLTVVAGAFTEILEAFREELRQRYGRDGDQGWRHRLAPFSTTSRPTFASSGPLGFDSRNTWLYCGPGGSKMTALLQRNLIDGELAVPDPEGSWVRTSPTLGSIYSATLTDAIARHNHLSPVTDDPRIHHAVGALDHLTELLFDEPLHRPALQGVPGAYLNIALEAVLEPCRLAEVPVTKLIKFRRRYAAELAAFRAHVAGLGPELRTIAEVEDVAVATAHLRALYAEATKPKLDELRRALFGLGVESGAGTLALKIDLKPVAGTLLGLGAEAAGHPGVAASAVALTVVPYLAGRARAAWELRKNSPVAYLLRADRAL